MRILSRLLVCGALLVLATSNEIRTAGLADQLEVSIEVKTNPAEHSRVADCETAVEVKGTEQRMWASFGQAEPSTQAEWRVSDGAVTCGVGSFEDGSSETRTGGRAPYLIATIKIFAGLLPSMLTPERVLVLNVSLTVRKLTGFGEQDEPLYQESDEKRKFYFLQGGEAFLPLLVADETEEAAFGISEVMLEVTAGSVGDETAATYGVVRVISEREGHELLLDGGVVGRTSAGRETELTNVPAGLRIVAVRDASGREVRKLVRVEADRTVLVDLTSPGRHGNPDRYRLNALGENEQGYEEYRRGSDGATMVKIPAGEYLMGNKETEGSPLEHTVYVSEFLIDKKGVTWGQYKRFAETTGVPLPPRDPYWGIQDDHPVVFVTWEDARAYCAWAGGRLPTEAEREKASRGTDRRKYPWGNEEPAPRLGVFRSEWGRKATAPVGSHPAGVSPFGVLDMGGNVWEWCSDWHDREYFTVSPYRDPKGPSTGIAHVLKGGSWDSRPSVLSCSSRNFGYRGYRELDFGFRCAMNAPDATAGRPAGQPR